MAIAQRLEGIGEYYFSQKLAEIDRMNHSGTPVINLGIGSPDLPPHPEVIERLVSTAANAGHHAYQSYRGSILLRKAIANWYQQWYQVSLHPESEVLPLMGSKEGIMHIVMTYVNPGDPVFIPDPGYPTYASAARIAGADLITYDLLEATGWQPDFATLESQIQQIRAAKKLPSDRELLLFLNYPHMPTGQLPEKQHFEEWVRFAREHHLLLIHDNPYSFILNENPLSLLEVSDSLDVAIELNSLSKSHNMAGWRVGCLLANAQRVNEILRFKSNMDSGMFLPVQLAAAHALGLPISWHESLNDIYRSRREIVYNLLQKLNCRFSTRQAGLFVWAGIPEGWSDGYAFSDAILQQARVFITPGGIFGKNGLPYIRLSLCQPVAVIEEAQQRIAAHFKL